MRSWERLHSSMWRGQTPKHAAPNKAATCPQRIEALEFTGSCGKVRKRVTHPLDEAALAGRSLAGDDAIRAQIGLEGSGN